MALLNMSNDIRKTTKIWYQKNPNINPFSKKLNNAFIKFFEKSGESECMCINGFPIFKTEERSDGTKYVQIRCSQCGGKYYKRSDFSFVMLILGRKGGGKTTSVFMFSDILHKIDKHRKIKLWQCPQNLIGVLHNLKICNHYNIVCERAMGEMKWSKANPVYHNPDDHDPTTSEIKRPPYQEREEKHRICKFTDYTSSQECQRCPHFQLGKNYFYRIDRLEEIEYNDIIILDEGIISVNAKEALSKKMRNWDKFLAVVRHFRACLFVLFQRFEVIKSLREMSDMILYKSLPTNLIENEQRDQIIKKYGDRIVKLERGEGLLASSHQDFNDIGILENRVPDWYTDEVSMSYVGDMSFVNEKEANQQEIDRAKMMAQWLIDQNYPPIKKPDEIKGAKFKLREAFKDLIPPPSSKELTMSIEAYYALTIYDGVGLPSDTEFQNAIANDEENLKFFEDMKKANITEKELAIFHEFVNGKSVTDFGGEPYNTPKQRVTEIVRDVGKYYEMLLKQGVVKGKSEGKEGEDAERKVVRNIWDRNGYAIRTVGSGGDREIPSPDVVCITQNGLIRPIQVKERANPNETFSPLTFNAELKIVNRLRKIAQNTNVTCLHCGEKVKGVLIPDKAYLYMTAKDSGEFIEEPLEYGDNKLTLKIDWLHKRVIRQAPDLDKIKSPKLKEFLTSDKNIYWGKSEDLLTENDQENDQEQEEIVNFDKLLHEVGISPTESDEKINVP